jgi:hypothetical protein
MQSDTLPLSARAYTDTNESMVIQSRTVYGRGTVVTLARFEDGIFFLEDRAVDRSIFIPLLSSEAREQLRLFIQHCEACKHL